MPVILKLNASPEAHYVSGANGDAVNFTEDASSALVFADAAAATAFATAKNIHGAVQVTVTGLKNPATKSIA